MQNLINKSHIWMQLNPDKGCLALFFGIVVCRLAYTNPVLLLTILMMTLGVWLLHLASGSTPMGIRMLGLAGAIYLGMAIFAPEAAQAAGFGSWAKAVKSQLGDIYDAGIYAAYGIGLFATYMGINNGIKKSKGDQQITGSAIFGPGIGGPVLMMLGYAAQSGAETVGGGTGQMNRLP